MSSLSKSSEFVLSVAMMCHEANKELCEIYGDMSQKSWNEAEQWQRNSAINGVMFALENPHAGSSAQHDAWVADKEADGWVYGETKDPEKKTHPCMVSYDQLPPEQRAKDLLFRSIVQSALAGYGLKI